MTSVIKEMEAVDRLIKQFIKLYKMEAPMVVSNQLTARTKAINTVDFLEPKIRDTLTFYVRKFCNNKHVSKDDTRLIYLRKIILDVREFMWVPLSKTYAKMLHMDMDKNEKVLYE